MDKIWDFVAFVFHTFFIFFYILIKKNVIPYKCILNYIYILRTLK